MALPKLPKVGADTFENTGIVVCWSRKEISTMQKLCGLYELDKRELSHRWMRKALLFLTLAAIWLAMSPSVAYAAEPRSGDIVVVGPDEVIDDDLYAFGSTVDIQGTVRGDVIAFAQSVTVSGTVTGDLIAAGATVSVPGSVEGSIRAGAVTLALSGAVGEDVVAGARELGVGQDSSIGRDLLAGAESIRMQGQVGRRLTAGANNLTIGGSVGGDVKVEVESLTITDGAVIGGNLVYTSDNQATIGQGAQIRGTVEQREPRRPERADDGPGAIVGWFQTLIGMFLTGLLFVLLLPRFSGRTIETLRSSPWASLGLGVLSLLVTPLAALLLFVLGLFIGGWWIGLILLAIFAIAMVLGFVIAGLFTGRQVVERIGRPDVHLLVALAIGLAILLLIGVVPFLGPLVVILATLFGLGTLILAAWRARQGQAETV
jgi:cytoskeletal protein CcmA (bactofilin family)